MIEDEVVWIRPVTYGECVEWGYVEACPFVSCRHNLTLEVNARSKSIKIRPPDKDLECQNNCSLFLSEGPYKKLDEIAAIMGTSRQRIQQIEEEALRKLKIKFKAVRVNLTDMLPFNLGD